MAEQEQQDDAAKTEDPTPKRLETAREKGQVAVSQEVKHWAVLLGGAFGVAVLAPGIMHGVARTALPFVEAPHAIALDAGDLPAALTGLLLDLALTLAPLVGLVVALALAAGIGQVGLLWAPTKIAPKLEKISLVKGVQRLFSLRSLVEFAKGIVKLAAVAAVASALVLSSLDDLELFPALPLAQILDRIQSASVVLVVATAAVMTVIAVLDYGYQKFSFLKQMRMTMQEVRDEHKQAEGDPQIKARIRRLRQERARKRMMAAVPEADVVITNPTHYAVALAYDMAAMGAPKLVAKGADRIAQRIREVALEHEVPLVENPPLARALYAGVDLDQEIPAEHYQAVAQVIGYVMRLKGRLS
ncbi:MAG: flagellar biosynthesis protein FlhB [Rhodospirillales bacterium]